MPDTQHITPALEGDGRLLVRPSPAYRHKGNPRSLPLGRARDLVRAFQQSGESYHSSAGSLVWILVEWADLNSVPIRVTSTTFKHETGRSQVTAWSVRRLPGAPVEFEHVDR